MNNLPLYQQLPPVPLVKYSKYDLIKVRCAYVESRSALRFSDESPKDVISWEELQKSLHSDVRAKIESDLNKEGQIADKVRKHLSWVKSYVNELFKDIFSKPDFWSMASNS